MRGISASLLVFAFGGGGSGSGSRGYCQRQQQQRQQIIIKSDNNAADAYGGSSLLECRQHRQRQWQRHSSLSSLFATRKTSLHDDDSSSSSSSSSSSTTTTASAIMNLEVCMSPGCIADGANEALLKLQALSSTSKSSTLTGTGTGTGTDAAIVVQPGVCCSLCGNGPVVFDKSNNKKYRNVLSSNTKILDIILSSSFLDDDDNGNDNGNDYRNNMNKILDGINICFDGDEALKAKDYIGAIEKYSMAIDIGMNNPIIINSLIKKQQDDTTTTKTAALNWLINAHCNKAKSLLVIKDIDGAIISAEKASELSLQTSIESFIILQDAYQKRNSNKGENNDTVRELHVLQSLFDLLELHDSSQPVSKKKKSKPIMDVNKRRTLGFRLTKLQQTSKQIIM
jgi:tetratricopeptide (TPR) repeat protein